MKRIDLTKYGFTRTPEADFSDDGNRFTCYVVGRVRVSKLVSDGEVYLAGSIEGNKLAYEEYSKLSHYPNMNELNGVTLTGLTEDDLQKFYEDCITYETEYTKAEAETTMPTYDEILVSLRKINRIRHNELNDILLLTSVDKLLDLNEYDLTTFQRYFKSLKGYANENVEAKAGRVVGSALSKQLVKAKYIEQECKPSFYYNQLLELIEEAKNK